jgi:hypothetical protein
LARSISRALSLLPAADTTSPLTSSTEIICRPEPRGPEPLPQERQVPPPEPGHWALGYVALELEEAVEGLAKRRSTCLPWMPCTSSPPVSGLGSP